MTCVLLVMIFRNQDGKWLKHDAYKFILYPQYFPFGKKK